MLILGEALGATEAHEGEPFVKWADAGAVLERAFKRAGMARESFRLWNIVGCQPPKNWLEGAPYEMAAVSHCRPALERVIEEMRPRCILTLGNVATRTLTGLAGDKLGIGYLRGYVLPSLYNIPVVPSYHPSFLRRGAMALFSVLVHDIRLAVEVAKDGRVPVDPMNPPVPSGYILHPSEDDAYSFLHRVRDNSIKLLTYDIETPRSAVTSEEETDELGETEILSIQFSLGKGEGIFIPWREPFATIARSILSLSNPKAAHNSWRFDDPLLFAHDAPIGGVRHDTRWAWHHLQPELKGSLQFVASLYGWPFPWKHLHDAKPEAYGLYDVDSLHWICGEA